MQSSQTGNGGPLWWGDFPRGDALDRIDTFAYLVELTRLGLKPLSQWEGTLTSEQKTLLERTGLARGVLRRLPETGGEVITVVFGCDPALVRKYVNLFDGASLVQTPDRLRIEGEHFGYPRCCVESFIARGFAPNDLAPETQDILFHWACRGCGPTQELAEHYRQVYETLLNGSNGRVGGGNNTCE